ncbi:MAG: transketolase family protein [Brevinematia bacterium]
MADKIATREAYGRALAELGEKYKNIIVLDADLSKSTRTELFKAKFPERFINCGVAEANMMATAAGIATCGNIVFASTFAMFAAGRAYDQVRNSIGYPHLNVKIGASHAGISVGEDGASHQCIEDIALMRVIPGMTVVSPCDAVSTRFLVEEAIKIDGPVYLRLGRLAVEAVYEGNPQDFKIGQSITLREGKDLTIIATGLMVQQALMAFDILKQKGISARVIDMHTIKPIDEKAIVKAARETGLIITCEEHNIMGGLGSAVSEVVSENYPVLVSKIGVRDQFGRSGDPSSLLKKYGLTAEDIVSRAVELLKRK